MVKDDEQLADLQRTETIIAENKTLKAFKLFFQVPCEHCGRPIDVWDEYNAKLVVDGIGFGHTSCWKTPKGHKIELLRALQHNQKGGDQPRP